MRQIASGRATCSFCCASIAGAVAGLSDHVITRGDETQDSAVRLGRAPAGAPQPRRREVHGRPVRPVAPVEQFVRSGKGLWPRPVFSNQSVLVGPKGDPAGTRGLKDPFEAMRRIASSGSKYVSPANPTGRYLSELLLAGAGNPGRGDWYIESPLTRGRAMRFADEEGAYTIWGSFPFERYRGKHGGRLEAMVWETPIFHRTMATVVVNPEKIPGVNAEGARALEAYLLSPGTQAAIAAYRDKGLDRQTWWPAAFDNNPGQVLGSTAGEEED